MKVQVVHAALLLAINTAFFATPAAASCINGLIRSGSNARMSVSDNKRLIGHLEAGGAVKIRLGLTPGDKDSKPSTFWFSPVGVTIVSGIVYAESPTLKWPPTRYTSFDGVGLLTGEIRIRVSSNGDIKTAQLDNLLPPMAAQMAWCLLS